jgi:hypothetical protein
MGRSMGNRKHAPLGNGTCQEPTTLKGKKVVL